MAVEFRCPECRAKLRVASAPEAGEEVECPKCGHVFPAPEIEDADAPRPTKKKPAPAADDEDRPKKKPADDSPKKPEASKPKPSPGKDDQPRRKRVKKQETNKAALWAVIVGGVVVLGVLAGLLIWFLGRKSAAQEMMTYLPEDCDSAVGLNITQFQKYPAFFKGVEGTYENQPFKKATETVSKAIGTPMADLLDYVVIGSGGGAGGAIVIRTKKEFDTESLSKLPGAKQQSADGLKYYQISDIVGNTRAFAPTNRIIVLCPGNVSDGTFRGMLKGNKDNRDKTLVGRMGALGNRMTRGTFWWITLTPAQAKPAAQPSADAGGQDTAGERLRVVGDAMSGAKGLGFKASVGSRDVRFEGAIWCRDSEAASSLARKWKDSELGKGDEGEPPRWFKDYTNTLGDKKIGQQVLANLGFTSSGEVFIVRTAVETVLVSGAVGGLAGKITGTQTGSGIPNAGPGGGIPAGPPGMPGGVASPGM